MELSCISVRTRVQIPRTHVKPGVVPSEANSSTIQEQRTDSQWDLLVISPVLCLKAIRQTVIEQDAQDPPLASETHQ